MNVLHICANPKLLTEESTSKQLAIAFFNKLIESREDAEVENIDLYEPRPTIPTRSTATVGTPLIEGYVPTKEEEQAANYAMTQAARVNEADVLVLTMPMWNFSMPGILKSWLDHVLSPGMIYTVDRNETRPFHKLKKVVVIVASGDAFKENDPRDGLTPAITAAFAYAGVSNIGIAWADGQDPINFRDCEYRKNMAIEMAEELAEEIAELVNQAE
ncbi:MAG: NAD(P)H-dependent oxidoreductase [Kiritimatiellia bacterium]